MSGTGGVFAAMSFQAYAFAAGTVRFCVSYRIVRINLSSGDWLHVGQIAQRLNGNGP